MGSRAEMSRHRFEVIQECLAFGTMHDGIVPKDVSEHQLFNLLISKAEHHTLMYISVRINTYLCIYFCLCNFYFS